MITAGTSVVWDIDLKDLRNRFPEAALSGDEQSELVNFLRKKFEVEIPEDQRDYSRMNIHLECETGADENLDFALGGEYVEANKRLKTYPVTMKAQSGGKAASCTIGVEPGLLSFYPKLSRLHDSTQEKVTFKVRVKYMS
jgi:hypothetical protein